MTESGLPGLLASSQSHDKTGNRLLGVLFPLPSAAKTQNVTVTQSNVNQSTNMKSQVIDKWREESSIEAKELLNKFTQWREDSRRQLAIIISSYNKSIDKGFDELVKELSYLHAKVSVIMDEEEEEEPMKDEPIPILDEKIKALQHRFGNRVIISPKFNEKCQVAKPEDNIQINDEVSFSSSSFDGDIKSNEEAGEESKENLIHDADLVKRTEEIQRLNTSGKDKQKKKFRCDHCPYETTLKIDLSTHRDQYDHYRRWKCERCPFETRVSNTSLKIHINDVHDEIRKYSCEQCGYAATQKGSLRKHEMFVHKVGGKTFSCEMCPYTTFQSGNLKNHIKHVHAKVPYPKKVCELCGYSNRSVAYMRRHMESVHKQRLPLTKKAKMLQRMKHDQAVKDQQPPRNGQEQSFEESQPHDTGEYTLHFSDTEDGSAVVNENI